MVIAGIVIMRNKKRKMKTIIAAASPRACDRLSLPGNIVCTNVMTAIAIVNQAMIDKD
jgi:hypothetical protein